METDQHLTASKTIAEVAGVESVKQPSAEGYAENQNNIIKREYAQKDVEKSKDELEEAEAEQVKHPRLIPLEASPKYKLVFAILVLFLSLISGATLLNLANYALTVVDNEMMAAAFSVTVLGIAMAKIIAEQKLPGKPKTIVEFSSMGGLLVCSIVYIYAIVQKFGLEPELTLSSVLVQTDDRLLLFGQILCEIFIISITASTLFRLFEKRKSPHENTRRLYWDAIVQKLREDYQAKLKKLFELDRAIYIFEVNRRRYEAFCNSLKR